MNDSPLGVVGLRHNILSLRYLLLGFALSWLPLPASGLAVVPLLMSLYHGARYLTEVRRAGVQGMLLPNVIGLVLTGALAVMVAAPLVHYERTLDYQECLWGANTLEAKDACQAAYGQETGAVQKFFFD